MYDWHVSSLVCTFIGLLLLVIAVVSDYWMANDNRHAGLWKVCIGYVCIDDVSVLGAHVYVTQGFTILGALFGVVSTGLLCAQFRDTQIGSFSSAKKAAYFNYSAGLCTLIAMSVFTGVENAPSVYSWSFGLGWASCPLFFIAGGLAHKMFCDATAA